MTKYFYARHSKVEINKATGKEELMLEVPVMVNPETVKENHQKVCMVKIGWKEYLCTYIWIPESFYLKHKRMLEQEAKADERSNRCLIPDGQGGKIVCPERNRCNKCKKCLEDKFGNGHSTSLDALQESGYDAETGDEFESDFDYADTYGSADSRLLAEEELQLVDELSRQILRLLIIKNPKYGLIFRERLKGVMKASDIARNTGLKANRTCEDLPKVLALAAQYYAELKK